MSWAGCGPPMGTGEGVVLAADAKPAAGRPQRPDDVDPRGLLGQAHRTTQWEVDDVGHEGDGRRHSGELDPAHQRGQVVGTRLREEAEPKRLCGDVGHVPPPLSNLATW